MEAYPHPAALAGAPPADVLAVWSGLGYNRRALRLQESARHIAGAGWPVDAAGLRQLPGVGPYTAAAVACFAFGEQVSTIDTNLRRVLSRWHGRPLHGDSLTLAAGEELPAGRAAEWNQAVMDLGSLICRPREPRCLDCPVAEWCSNPEVYVPPPPQGTFRGSKREARGAVMRSLVDEGRKATVIDLAERTGLERARIGEALGALVNEGLVRVEGDVFSLPRE
jgi:A/G-specific adenine glycosylase